MASTTSAICSPKLGLDGHTATISCSAQDLSPPNSLHLTAWGDANGVPVLPMANYRGFNNFALGQGVGSGAGLLESADTERQSHRPDGKEVGKMDAVRPGRGFTGCG